MIPVTAGCRGPGRLARAPPREVPPDDFPPARPARDAAAAPDRVDREPRLVRLEDDALPDDDERADDAPSDAEASTDGGWRRLRFFAVTPPLPP
jgi:hypothetical protein